MKQESSFVLASPKNPIIAVNVTPGHFATGNSHVNYYMDMSMLKTNVAAAKDVALELAIPYQTSAIVDTIICLEGTEMIGAFLAEELLQNSAMFINSDRDLHVITPLHNVNNQLIFPPNEHELIKGKNIILVMATVSSGMTVFRALECLDYYGGVLVGISALFAAIESIREKEINAVFSIGDIEDYKFNRPSRCEMCKEGIPLDAIVNSNGFTRL